VLFAHGALGTQGIDELAIVARLFGLYLPGAAFALVFARLLVIVGQIRRLPITNAALLLMHGGVCWLLVHFYGPKGIPLSVALVSSIQALAYGAFLRQQLFDSTRNMQLASLLFVAVVCFGCSYLSGQLALPDAARVGVVGVVSLLSSAAAAHLLGLPFARGLARLRAF
jgi:peptidoglycan biosynthesis protein MviN/MurJ (putative lipid II flippase)